MTDVPQIDLWGSHDRFDWVQASLAISDFLKEYGSQSAYHSLQTSIGSTKLVSAARFLLYVYIVYNTNDTFAMSGLGLKELTVSNKDWLYCLFMLLIVSMVTSSSSTTALAL